MKNQEKQIAVCGLGSLYDRPKITDDCNLRYELGYNNFRERRTNNRAKWKIGIEYLMNPEFSVEMRLIKYHQRFLLRSLSFSSIVRDCELKSQLTTLFGIGSEDR